MVLRRIARSAAGVVLLLLATVALAQDGTTEPEARVTARDQRALAGAYATTVAREDARAQDFYVDQDLVGEWTPRIDEDGHIDWRYLGPDGERSYTISGVYVLYRDELILGAEVGPHPCRDMYGVAYGAYRYEQDEDGLRLTVVEDACIQRRIVLTARPLRALPPD